RARRGRGKNITDAKLARVPLRSERGVNRYYNIPDVLHIIRQNILYLQGRDRLAVGNVDLDRAGVGVIRPGRRFVLRDETFFLNGHYAGSSLFLLAPSRTV